MTKRTPLHKGKYGRVRFSVWENQTKNGTLYNVTINRVFLKTNPTTGIDEFRNTSSFSRDDLELVILAAEKARDFIDHQKLLAAVQADSSHPQNGHGELPDEELPDFLDDPNI